MTEGDAATFEVVLSHASHEDIVVAAAAGSGTATAGTDFDASPQNVTIPAGTLSAAFTIQTTQDAVYEPDEDFSVSFSGGVTGEVNLVPGSVSGTIVNDDSIPVLSIGDATILEGGIAVFTVSLSGASSEEIAVNVSTLPGTAGVDDLDLPVGLVVFAPGETSRTFEVQTLADGLDEPDEDFSVHLDSVGAGTASISGVADTGVGTILDNNATPSVIVHDADGDEGTVLSFVVELSGASSQNTTLTLGTIDGTAVSPDDFFGNNRVCDHSRRSDSRNSDI
ncbi:MAG: Calx-beta domain-containing protein [Planctomycetaceae bacterium]